MGLRPRAARPARGLSPFFKKVMASDASGSQLKSAEQSENINYRNFPAGKADIADQTVNLVTVAQALHWFDFGGFYAEVNRVLKPGGS